MGKLEHEIAAIFNTDDGGNDLSRRLDEFIQNRQAVEKPVQMAKIFEQLKNVLKKGVKGPIKYEHCLQIMVKLSSINPEMFIDGETPQMILKGFEKMLALKCSDKQESRRISTIGNVLEIVTAISDVSEDGKSAVLDFVLPCLNLLADKQNDITIKVEANRFLNGVIDSFLRLNRDFDVQSLPFVSKFDDLIINAGDLELQLCMTELVCRMLSAELRHACAQMWFKQHPKCRDDFIVIRDAEFETDCRKFVNNMNERQLENRSVYSVLCKEVYLGSQKVNCPSDDGDDGMFWTDFSLGSKSISFFAIDEENDVWETVTIKKNAVLQTQISAKKESHETILLVQLDTPACTLLSSVEQSEEKYVKFIYDEKNSPLTAASLLFPKDFVTNTPTSPDVIDSTPKASVTSKAVRVSSRAKGLSKTVSLSAQKRRKGKGESDDESLKSNDSASKKDKQSKKPVSSKKNTSGSDIKGDNTQIGNPTVADEKTKQRSSRISGNDQVFSEVSDSGGNKGKKGANRKPGKAKEFSMPDGEVVAGDERSKVRTRSIRSNDAGKHNDQKQTEHRSEGNGLDNVDEAKKGRDSRSMDESGLGKSIDSGLGKSMDFQDLTMEEEDVKKKVDVKKEGHFVKERDVEEHVMKEEHVLKDISQDEPTVIHATQTFSQEDVDDHIHFGNEVSKDHYEELPSVAVKKSGVDVKDVKDVDRDSSSGPFLKTSAGEISKTREVEKVGEESSAPYIKKTTKPVKAKASTKTRQIRTRAAAKKIASIGSSVSTSESERTITKQTDKAKAKSTEPRGKTPKAIARGVVDIDERNKLGSGYNTEDWMMGYSDAELRTGKKKALENASNASKSRLSLISTVYRANYKTEYKYKRKKAADPYEFRTNEKETFSDVAFQVQQKHRERERELKKHLSEGDIPRRESDYEPDEQSTKETLSDGKEISETRRNLARLQGGFKDVEENEENQEGEKAMKNREGEEKVTARQTIDDTERLAKKSKRDTSVDKPIAIQSSLMDEESKMLLNHVFGQDNEDGDVWTRDDTEQVEVSKGQRGIKPGADFNDESPAKKSARDTDRSRGKQIGAGEEVGEVFDDGNGDSVLEPKQTKRSTVKRSRSASDSNARLLGEKHEKGIGEVLHEDDVQAEDEMAEETSSRSAQKRISLDRKYAKEQRDGEELSSGTASILDAFKKNFERIIEDSDDCLELSTKTNKSSTSRKQMETISKNKASKFEANTPQLNLSRAGDSGFFDKTSSASSKKRTSSSVKDDVQNETPGGLRRSRRFGCLDVQSTTPRRGYRSNDDKSTSRVQDELESGEEDSNLFSYSQPVSGNQGSRKRTRSRETKTGFKPESKMPKRKKSSGKDDDFEFPDSISELIKGMDGQNRGNDVFKTPVDSQSMSIQPRKLFQSSDNPTPRKRQKVSRESRRADNDDDDEEDEDEDVENQFDVEDSIGEEMQSSFINLGKEVKKTIKQRQDYVSHMASATMKLIAAKSEEMWSKQSSRRHNLMNDFTSCVNKYVEDHQQIASKRQQIEDDMISQVDDHLKALAKQRIEQEKCLRSIIKTQKAFTETFKSIEDAEQTQHMDFLETLRMELKQYRDKAAQEVQKQEFDNIKRRIQAMLGMSL